MEVNVLEQKRRVEIWLTKDESNNSEVLETVEQLINEYRSKKYWAVIFRSGTDDLLKGTELLLAHNKTG